MDEKRLTQIMREIAQEEIPDDMNLWSDIQNAAQQTSRGTRIVPRSRIGWAALLVTALLTIGAGVYAVGNLLSSFGDPGLEAADNANLVVHFNETQTIGNVSVTLEYAYADANRIAIAYSGTALMPVNTNSSPGFTEVRLTDDQEREYNQYLFGGGGGGGGGGPEMTVSPVSFGNFDNYDASIIEGTPEELHLRLELTVGDLIPIIGQSGGGGGGSASLMPAATAEPFEDVGPFIFELTVPFNPGLVMDQTQIITAADIPMTLNRVVVTPSLTRLELCFEQPPTSEDGLFWEPLASLGVNGEQILSDYPLQRDALSSNPSVESECQNYNLSQSLVDQTGEWTFTIDALHLPGSADQDLVRQALRERGIETMDNLDGSFGGYITPPGADYEEISGIVEQVFTELEEKITGPWTFEFSVQ